ncbi:MAG: S8 family serine peptidase [Cyanobacteriota bacterium]|nr:S8 family serine peptidase [Cyanobacteriota bacterium]
MGESASATGESASATLSAVALSSPPPSAAADPATATGSSSATGSATATTSASGDIAVSSSTLSVPPGLTAAPQLTAPPQPAGGPTLPDAPGGGAWVDASVGGRAPALGDPPGVGDGAAAAASPPPTPPGRLLVQWVPDATEAERAAPLGVLGATRKKLIQTAPMRARGEGVLEVVELPAGADPQAALALYAATAGVRFAEVDELVRVQAVSNDPEYTNTQLWGMYGSDSPTPAGPTGTTNPFGINAEGAWNLGFTGSSSVFVGILDQGIDFQHEDLAANMWINPYELPDGIDNDGNGYIDDNHGWNFLDDNNIVFDVMSDEHGTHVAGTIGAAGGNGTGVVGVNWDVTMIPAKFLGPWGGYVSGAILALDYITDLKWRHGLNIVATNNAWTAIDTPAISAITSKAMREAIVRSAREDILFVASAGNQGSNNDLVSNFPSQFNTSAEAGYDAVVTVTAIDRQGQLASFSNFGPATVDLGAPGVDIFSTFPFDSYDLLSGTSMATPHVTGAIALYASRYPGSTAEQIRAALLASTIPTSSLAGTTASGGRLNVLNFLNTPPTPAFSITAAQPHLAEGQAGSATPFQFTVTRHGPSAAATSVSWSVAGSGSTPADHNDFVGQVLPSGTLTFAPEDTSKTITVWLTPDSLQEADETFTVSLLNPSPGTTLAAGRGSASSRVLNDDGVLLAFHSAAITIPSFGSATTSPATLTVASGSVDPISSVEVTLYNLYHTSPDDLDILLVGPTGQKTLLMSDAGGANSVDGITLTFSAQASAALPDSDPLTSGRWRPVNHFNTNDFGQANDDHFDSLAPSGPYSADLDVFNGTNPDGSWRLFVRDDTSHAAGKIIDGWSLAITTQPLINPVSLTVSPDRVREDGLPNLIYTFSRTGSLQNPLSVGYTTAGTATPDTDYTGIPSSGLIKTVTFAAGSATATVVVDPLSDADVEGPETVSLTLVEGTGYTISTPGAVVGVIDDDDAQVMEGSGASRLLRDTGNRLFVQPENGGPVGLRFRNRAILQTSFPGWEPLAAESFSGVNQMIWRNLSGNYLSLWTMDSNWSWFSSTGEWGMNSPGALLQETRFGIDFNGNGTIG